MPGATPPAAADGEVGGSGSSTCQNELVVLLCAMRSLLAFVARSSDSLLASLPNLHKILVVAQETPLVV